MKGESAMRIPACVAALSVMLPIVSSSQVTGVVQRAEALQAKLERFASIPSSDVIEPGETNTVSYADECNDFFCAYIDSMGWTTNQAVESLMVVVSNLVCSVDSHSNNFLRICTAEVALNCLERHGSSEQIQSIEPLIVTSDKRSASLLAECLVNREGLDHSAFASYKRLIDSDIPEVNAIRLLGTIGSKMAFGQERPSAAVTNRYAWLSLSAIAKHPWGAVCDTTLFKCWPEYVTSSNRLESLNLCLEQGGMSDVSSNAIIRIRNELLALPPGTMQMLPTNQFYNVED